MMVLHQVDVDSAAKVLEIQAAFICKADTSILKTEEACNSELLATLLTYAIW
jgi:hypothetical protein